MSRKFLNGIDLVKTQIINALLHVVAGDPGSPAEGQIWWDSSAQRVGVRGTSTTHKLVRDGGDLSAGSVANTALTTNPLARANHTGTQTASTISDFDTQVRTSRLDQLAAPTAAVSLNSQKITGLATPTAGTDAANKNYVDTSITGFSWKTAVRAATTTNGTLASSFANGSVIDGVTLATNDRILLKNQTTGGENGIYTVNATGAPTRATDNDTAAEMLGAAVMVQEGTINQNTQWIQTVDGAITLGTTATVWTQFGGGQTYTAGNGLTLSTNDFNVGAGTGISVAADSVAIDTAVVVRKYAATIGNGSSTSIAVAHSLGTQDVTYSVRQVSDNAFVECDAVSTDANTLTLTFAVAPASTSLRVVVHA